MELEYKIKELIKNYPLDIRAEVLMAELVEMGLDPKRIFIQPIGIFRRFYQKDVVKVDFTYSDLNKIELVHISVNREGLYDSLPEGLFHQPRERNSYKSKDLMKEEVKVHRQEEKNARNFFKPLEREFYNQRIYLEQQEREALLDFSNELIKKFWDLPKGLNSKQTNILLYILPAASRIVGNLKLTELCLTAILEAPVRLKIGTCPVHQAKDDDCSVLGQGILGVNNILGAEFIDGVPAVKLTIGPISPKEVSLYLPSGRQKKLLDWISGYFIPIEWDIETHIEVDNNELIFELNSENSILGYAIGI